jgi:hypothetical protein
VTSTVSLRYVEKEREKYGPAPVSTYSVSAVYGGPKKNLKIEEIKVYKLQNAKQNENGPNMYEIQQTKRAQYLTHLPLPPYPRFPTELTSFLLLAFSLFALVAALSHCLCSESPYLSIKLYRIYVCYTNITLHKAFGIIRGIT